MSILPTAPKKLVVNPLANKAGATVQDNKRPTTVPRDRAADGFLNLHVIDTVGNRFRLPNVVVSLHAGFGRKLDDGMLEKAYAYEAEMAAYKEAIEADPDAKVSMPVKPEFKVVGEVTLVPPSVDPQF